MQELIEKIKTGEEESFVILYQRFEPLIYKWLKQSKELYQQNAEDYKSAAKVILYECARNYQPQRQVPFQSYYKISLYHWYANHKRKKQVQEVELMGNMDNISQQEIGAEVIRNEQKRILHQAIDKLKPQEKIIIRRILQHYTTKEIAEELHLSRKTVLNKKYEAISKLKVYLKED